MADIFVSYKRADRERVAQIVALLENEGWTVWWDNRVFGGAHWDALIERELRRHGALPRSGPRFRRPR